VATCIFCCAPLDRTTKPEHILHDALGGRKTTRRVICSGCNNRFGGTIDKALAEQFSVIRTLLQLRSGTGALPPMLKGVTAGSETIDIGKGGRLKLVSKPFRITKDILGNTQIHISGESLDKIEPMVPHMAAALKISEDRLRQLLSVTEGSSVERRPDPIRLDLPGFGGTMPSAAMRPTVSSASPQMNRVGTRVGPIGARSPRALLPWPAHCRSPTSAFRWLRGERSCAPSSPSPTSRFRRAASVRRPDRAIPGDDATDAAARDRSSRRARRMRDGVATTWSATRSAPASDRQ
jgi:hypothetical protein